MARFVYETAENVGFDPCLLCNVLDHEYDVRVTDFARFETGRELERTTVAGMELVGIPRILPEFEFFQHVLNRHYWREALADGDAYFGIGGSNQCFLPMVLEDKEFGAWTATPFWPDRRVRVDSASLPRRVRDYLSKPVMEVIERRVYEATEHVYVLSEYTARHVSSKTSVPRKDISVIPYPINTDLFTPDGEQPATVEEEKPTVLFVGRFNDTRKNTRLLIDAAGLAHDQVEDIRVILVGDEPDADLRRVILDNGLENQVEWHDHVDNEKLPAFYRAADAFAIPSKQEGLAIVGLEAMACGTPVVSTRCGGPEEYVEDGETGFLVDSGDNSEFTDRLVSLLQNESLRNELGANARSMVESRYAEEEVREQFVRALQRLV